MEKQFVTYEFALKFKELSFDEPCLAYFEDGELTHGMLNEIGKRKYLIAPLWQQIIDWFREKHSIYITELPYRNNKDNVELCWYYSVVEDSGELFDILCNAEDLGATDDLIHSFEKTREQAILKAIEIVKKRISNS